MPSLLYRLQPGPGPKLVTLYIFNDFVGVFFHAADRALWPILLSHPSVSLWVPLISIIRKTCAKIIINSRLCNYSRWGSFPLMICNGGFIRPCVRRDRWALLAEWQSCAPGGPRRRGMRSEDSVTTQFWPQVLLLKMRDVSQEMLRMLPWRGQGLLRIFIIRATKVTSFLRLHWHTKSIYSHRVSTGCYLNEIDWR